MTITYIITDAFGRTIEDWRETERRGVDPTDLDAMRAYAKQIECPCGVWVVPMDLDDLDPNAQLGDWGEGEEISPARLDGFYEPGTARSGSAAAAAIFGNAG